MRSFTVFGSGTAWNSRRGPVPSGSTHAAAISPRHAAVDLDRVVVGDAKPAASSSRTWSWWSSTLVVERRRPRTGPGRAGRRRRWRSGSSAGSVVVIGRPHWSSGSMRWAYRSIIRATSAPWCRTSRLMCSTRRPSGSRRTGPRPDRTARRARRRPSAPTPATQASCAAVDERRACRRRQRPVGRRVADAAGAEVVGGPLAEDDGDVAEPPGDGRHRRRRRRVEVEVHDGVAGAVRPSASGRRRGAGCSTCRRPAPSGGARRSACRGAGAGRRPTGSRAGRAAPRSNRSPWPSTVRAKEDRNGPPSGRICARWPTTPIRDRPAACSRCCRCCRRRPQWSGPELADRLGVTVRTVRRDVERLRRLGYPVLADIGTTGGYRLGAGGRAMPPLMLDRDEALAVAVCLRSTADRVDRRRRRGRDPRPRQARAAAAVDAAPPGRRDQHDDGRGSAAARRPSTPRCSSRSPGRAATASGCGPATATSGAGDRAPLDPHRLVTTARRWYLVARDVDRDAWRTLRVDRLLSVEATGHRVTIEDPPDPVALVQAAISTTPYRHQARVELAAPLADVEPRVPPTTGILEADRRRAHDAHDRRRRPRRDRVPPRSRSTSTSSSTSRRRCATHIERRAAAPRRRRSLTAPGICGALLVGTATTRGTHVATALRHLHGAVPLTARPEPDARPGAGRARRSSCSTSSATTRRGSASTTRAAPS